MAAPVKNTCPDIDKVIKNLKLIQSTAKDGMRIYKNQDDTAYELFKDCEWDIDSIIGQMEDLRNSNQELREWGKGLEDEIQESAEEINRLENLLELQN